MYPMADRNRKALGFESQHDGIHDVQSAVKSVYGHVDGEAESFESVV